MKKLIALLLLLVSLPSAATDIAYLRNRAGGVMTFTDASCYNRNLPLAMHVYTVSPGGETGIGCWTYEDARFWVVWSDGTIYSYPLQDVTLSAPMQKELQKRLPSRY